MNIRTILQATALSVALGGCDAMAGLPCDRLGALPGEDLGYAAIGYVAPIPFLGTFAYIAVAQGRYERGEVCARQWLSDEFGDTP